MAGIAVARPADTAQGSGSRTRRPDERLLRSGEDAMAGYGLFVLVLAVGAATVGYFWLRND
ncbi:hypothetical protein WOB59_08530 [Methylocystis sp. IM4]|uniref:hypothetical protein n=1 Tax=Methylocystis sp. IM4 TaxID=3136560 RepID=UPI003119DB2C